MEIMKTSVFTLLTCSLFLSSCALGAAAGVGTVVGVAAVQEGGLERAGSDAWIQAQINDLWLRQDLEMFRKLDITVNQGRVLLTGVVQNPEHRVEAVRLAWQPSGVKSVINEIKVADSDGIMGYAKDTWITTKLRSILLADREIESLNYSIDTVQGTVYLMGFAQDQQELDRAIGKARTVSGVKHVVSYVKLAGAPEGPDNLPPSYGQGAQYQDNARPGYNDAGYGATGYNDSGYNDSGAGYESGTQEQTSQGAGVPPVADGEPINWSQKSIYE
ncbi:MAG: BON domain-containing protein [Alphaproteobacteria bacterium]|nr:BON domain-containing protein [Alphaproteobacteria bacterium]MBP7759606.1 BON domain-containing protein [Alphaproteobacteria bacterium]MBP7763145.1 BON domain-containing protein [Alphaproteobacteria bacterium]MBP7904604.1 BON domain-containing protein [Alphaproteobacteria bacterium]